LAVFRGGLAVFGVKTMELSDLIAAVKAATTKNDLADLVKAELSLDLNKNKTLKALRAEVLNGLGVTESADEAAVEAVVEPAADVVVDSAVAEDVVAPQPLAIPPAESKPEPEPVSTPVNRVLRSTESGREFIWTAALSMLPEMEEV
jgi:hypothetical protein